MSGAAVLVLVAFCAFDLMLAPLIVRVLVGGVWGPLEGAFPARPPGEDSVRRDFQSYRFGIVNLGYSVHTTVDAEFLHLEPVRPLRLLGIGPISVPWGEIEPRRARGKRYAEVRIKGQRVLGPRWALQMAFAGEESGMGPGS